MNKKDIDKTIRETMIIVNRDIGCFDCDFGNEFDLHEWYSIDEAETIIENALLIAEKLSR